MATQRAIEEVHLNNAAEGLDSARSYIPNFDHPLVREFHEALDLANKRLARLYDVIPVWRPGWEPEVK